MKTSQRIAKNLPQKSEKPKPVNHMLNGYMPKFKRQHYPGTELNFRSGSRNNKITRKTSQSELNQLYEEDI
jgi:hypothetical protein